LCCLFFVASLGKTTSASGDTTLSNAWIESLGYADKRKCFHLLQGVAEEAVDKLNQPFASNSVKQSR
jgi:hypothetical protein